MWEAQVGHQRLVNTSYSICASCLKYCFWNRSRDAFWSAGGCFFKVQPRVHGWQREFVWSGVELETGCSGNCTLSVLAFQTLSNLLGARITPKWKKTENSDTTLRCSRKRTFSECDQFFSSVLCLYTDKWALDYNRGFLSFFYSRSRIVYLGFSVLH